MCGVSFLFTFGVHSSIQGLASGPLPTHKTPIHSSGGGVRLLSGFDGWVKLLRRSVPPYNLPRLRFAKLPFLQKVQPQ